MLVLATVTLGWIVAVQQLLRDGLVNGGTFWLFTFAAIGTVGLMVVLVETDPNARTWRVLGLIAASVSPGIYPINGLLLVAVVVEVAAAVRERHRISPGFSATARR